MDWVYGGPRGEDRGEKRAAVVSFFYYYDSFSEGFDFAYAMNTASTSFSPFCFRCMPSAAVSTTCRKQ